MSIGNTIQRDEMIRCLICEDAPCSHACPHLDPARALRSIWFRNEDTAAAGLPDPLPCRDCAAACETACVRAQEVPIRKLLMKAAEQRDARFIPSEDDADLLKTEICGIPVRNPFLLSSSVVASTYDMCARAFEAGWAGVSFKTICLMEIHEASPRFSCIRSDNGSIVAFKNIEQLSDQILLDNLAVFRKLKENYPDRFLLVSIMGRNEEEWGYLAREAEKAGADAVELNFSCPNMTEAKTGSDIGEIPSLVGLYTRVVKSACGIPVLAKLTPNVGRMSEAALAAKMGGADGIAAINTIKSVMDINPETFAFSPHIHGKTAIGGLSGMAVRPIALRFIHELGSNPALADMHISGMGGIETWLDALEFLVLGAKSLQVTTAVMQYGYRIIDDLCSGLVNIMKRRGIRNVQELSGAALSAVVDTSEIERDTILYPQFARSTCIGCERCYVSCRDGGHQAITPGADRKPVLNARRCVSCHLCVLICPTKSITPGKVRVPGDCEEMMKTISEKE